MLHHIFEHQAPLTTIKNVLHQLYTLHATILQALPEALRKYCHSVYWSKQTLMINITNSTAMSKIRQLCPQLLILLQEQGITLTSLKPVRFFEIKKSDPPLKIHHMTPAALQAFQNLQHTLSDTLLKQAIDTLIKAHQALTSKKSPL